MEARGWSTNHSFTNILYLNIFFISYILFKFKGFDEHLVSTIGEWLMAFSEIIYLFTFYTDYRRIKLKHPEICANSKSSLVVSTTSYQTMF